MRAFVCVCVCAAFGAFVVSKCLPRDMTTVTDSLGWTDRFGCVYTHTLSRTSQTISSLVNEINMKTWSINIYIIAIEKLLIERSIHNTSWKPKSRSSNSNATIGLIGTDTVQLNKHSNEINVLLKSPKLEIHDIEHHVHVHSECVSVCVLMKQFFVLLTSTQYTWVRALLDDCKRIHIVQSITSFAWR